MLKYENMISQLSDAQKIRILCDIGCLSEKEYRVLGIPEIKVGNLTEAFGAEFPSSFMLANSWNKTLVSNVAKTALKDMNGEGVTLAVTPGAKIKLSPYHAALSEDVVLASELAGEYLTAVSAMGLSACIDDFSLTPGEIEWLDKTPKSRVIFEYIVKPYQLAAKNYGFEGAIIAPDVQSPGYEKANSVLAKIAAEEADMDGAVPICAKAGMINTVLCIARGVLCFEGVAVALEAALNKYKQMKSSVESELISPKELEEEIADGRAISPEMIDATLDTLIDFAFACEKKRVLAPDIGMERESLALQAARESIVLLKNEKKILPVKKKTSVCLLGDIAMRGGFAGDFLKRLEEAGCQSLGMERGYDLDAERGEELLAPALGLAEKADVAFVFLGFGGEREKLIDKDHKISLPANQQVLLDRLGGKKTKVVAVISGNLTADFATDEKADAVLLAPLSVKTAAQALSEIVMGEYSPCGKLATTLYLNTDSRLKKQRAYQLRDGMKSGPFIGYRYYDTAGYSVGYPFGHGLGYADFVYSRLTVKDGIVSVTVKNTGKMKASETVQIYIGMESSAVLRPKKELMAFEKTELAPGEKKTLQFALRLPEVFDAESKRYLIEQGVYTVYAASSVSDVRLSCNVKAGEVKLEPDGEIKSDYLQSETNIIKDNYKLEADCDIMRKSVLNIVAGVAALLLAIILKAYCLLSDSNAMFFDILAVILAVSGWVFFVAEAVGRKRDRKTDKANIDEANKAAFAEAEELPIAEADKLFIKEFDTVTDDEVAAAVVEDYSDGFGAEHLIYVDHEHNFENAAREFAVAAAEKGYEFDASEVRKIFAAMASSRVLILNGMSDKMFKALMVLLGNYFESSVYIDYADSGYTSGESLLFKSDASGNRSKTNMMLAVESAGDETQKIHFAGLTGVKYSELAGYIAPVVKHAKNPAVRYTFTAHNEKNTETSFFFPQNLWFVINAAEGQSLGMLPASVAEIATVNSISFKECPAANTHANIKKFSFYQMEYLCEKLASFEVDELTWKKVDKLEAFIDAHAPYHIGNKLWLCLEKYAGVYMACGAEQNEAVDESVAAKLLPSMVITVDGKIARDEIGFAETVENIFGEDNVDACKKVIKTCGADIM